jgi:phosphoenolpyruvate carboxylase
MVFKKGDITIAEWIGKFSPENINVIPLIEDRDHMIIADEILKKYLQDKDVSYHRVFLARSDPAMNYGLITAVLINKIGLYRIYQLAQEANIDLYPIIGVGSAPFRGNLRPQTVKRIIKEYPSTQTFTIQSAFKYDNNPEDVINAIKLLKERKRAPPRKVEEKKCLEIMNKYSQEYHKQVILLAPLINKIAKYVPSRRKRKLHIGLFGYSRNLGDISLPRAITFTSALYSIGIPPEILALNALDDNDLDYVKTVYINFDDDLADALKYFNPEISFIPDGLTKKISELFIDYEQNIEHKEITDRIINSIKKNRTEQLSEDIVMAANIRQFLG